MIQITLLSKENNKGTFLLVRTRNMLHIIGFPVFLVIHCARFCEPLGVGTVSPWTETMSLGCVVDTLGDAFPVAIQILRCAAGRRCR